MSQNLQNFVKFQKLQLDNLVDFEKCCKTRIFLQKSVPIQPKTSNILPKFCRSAVVSPRRSRTWPRTALHNRSRANIWEFFPGDAVPAGRTDLTGGEKRHFRSEKKKNNFSPQSSPEAAREEHFSPPPDRRRGGSSYGHQNLSTS